MPRTRGQRENEPMITVTTRIPVGLYELLDKSAIENGNLPVSKMIRLIIEEAVTEIPQKTKKEE